jgi:DNA invertase Pin-like site-specific DNA recombinase
MLINAVIYARESADCPHSLEEQIDVLNVVAHQNGWAVSSVCTDRPLPIKKGRERRPGEAALLATVRSGEVQKVLVISIDRLGRTLVDLVGLLQMCRAAGVGLYFHEQTIDTGMSNGLSVFDIMQMMAHHVRQARRDRILRGQAEARAAMVRFGRPPIPMARVERAKQGLAAGKSVRQVARLAGISAASVCRIKSTPAA